MCVCKSNILEGSNTCSECSLSTLLDFMITIVTFDEDTMKYYSFVSYLVVDGYRSRKVLKTQSKWAQLRFQISSSEGNFDVHIE